MDKRLGVQLLLLVRETLFGIEAFKPAEATPLEMLLYHEFGSTSRKAY